MYDKLRRFPRLDSKSLLKVALFDNFEAERLQLSSDISTGGCHFLSEQQYGKGTILSMQILLMSKTIKPSCRVIWEKPRDDGHFDIGVEFLIISKAEQDLIAEYISSCERIASAS